MKFIYTLLICSILFSACEKDCPGDSQLADTVKLASASINSNPYAGKSQAVFVNENNDTLKYLINGLNSVQVRDYNLGVICTKKDSESYLNAEVEFISGLLSFNGTPTTDQVDLFQFDLGIRNINSVDPMDTVLVDGLLIYSTLHTETPSPGLQNTNNRIEIIANNRGNEDSEFLSNINEDFRESVTFNGMMFNSVYKSTNQQKQILYNFEQGIIAFEDQTDLWVLSRLE